MQIVDKTMSDLFSNSYSSAIITLFLVLYGGLAAPKLPSFVADLFENPVFRIIVLSLIVYKGQRDPAMALMIGIGFTVTLNMINKQKFFENMTSITKVPSCHAAKEAAKKTHLPVSRFEQLCNKNLPEPDFFGDDCKQFNRNVEGQEAKCDNYRGGHTCVFNYKEGCLPCGGNTGRKCSNQNTTPTAGGCSGALQYYKKECCPSLQMEWCESLGECNYPGSNCPTF